MAPPHYDPHSAEEQPVPLPSAPRLSLGNNIVLQPPLTRRGTGPGLIVFLPSSNSIEPRQDAKVSLDPEPVQKWAEEGFAVVGVADDTVSDSMKTGIAALQDLDEVDVKDKFGVAGHLLSQDRYETTDQCRLVYDPTILTEVLEAVATDRRRLVCVISYGGYALSPFRPLLVHLPEGNLAATTSATTVVHRYACSSPFFVFPQSAGYHSGSASIAHSRSLAFLRTHLGGPHFDLEAIWDEHTYFEFEVRSVAKTMSTMVVCDVSSCPIGSITLV
jgi:carboxymethylenebutenolidase